MITSIVARISGHALSPIGNRARLAALSLATASLVAVAATACDTDDGRTMETPSSQQTTTTPPPTTNAGGSPAASQPASLPAFVTGAPSTATTSPADNGVGALGNGAGNGAAADDISLSLPFEDGTNIPFEFTCRGQGVAPAVTFWSARSDLVEMALVVIDEDADDFVHWVVTGIDPTARVVSRDPDRRGVPAVNDFGEPGWGPPCPPKGDGEHTYRFTVYGLDAPLDVEAGADGDEVIARIESAAVASATATGTFHQ